MEVIGAGPLSPMQDGFILKVRLCIFNIVVREPAPLEEARRCGLYAMSKEKRLQMQSSDTNATPINPSSPVEPRSPDSDPEVLPTPSTRQERAAPEPDSTNKQSGLAEFLQKTVLLIIAFILTGLVGMAISENLKRSFAIEDFQLKTYQLDLEREQKVFDALSALMDRRLFRMRRVVDAFADNMPADAQSQRTNDYRSVFLDWNDNLNKNRAYFVFFFCSLGHNDGGANAECEGRYDEIVSGFGDAQKLIQKFIDHAPDASRKQAEDALNKLNVTVFGLDQFMLERMSSIRSRYQGILTRPTPWSAWLPTLFGGTGPRQQLD